MGGCTTLPWLGPESPHPQSLPVHVGLVEVRSAADAIQSGLFEGDGSLAHPFTLSNLAIQADATGALWILDPSSHYKIHGVKIYNRLSSSPVQLSGQGISVDQVEVLNAHGRDSIGLVLGGNASLLSNVSVSHFPTALVVRGVGHRLHDIRVDDYAEAGLRISGENHSLSRAWMQSRDGIVGLDIASNASFIHITESYFNSSLPLGTSNCIRSAANEVVVRYNTFQSCTFGIFLSDSAEGHVISRNYFGSDVRALDRGSQNRWNESVGNYWADYDPTVHGGRAPIEPNGADESALTKVPCLCPGRPSGPCESV